MPPKSTAKGPEVTLDAVTLRNNLPEGAAPGVAAPVSDQSGTIAWDIGTLGTWHDRG